LPPRTCERIAVIGVTSHRNICAPDADRLAN